MAAGHSHRCTGRARGRARAYRPRVRYPADRPDHLGGRWSPRRELAVGRGTAVPAPLPARHRYEGRMKKRCIWLDVARAAVVTVASATSVFAGQEAPLTPVAQEVTHTRAEGPPLSLRDAVDDALVKNPELLALRAQLPVVRAKPAQERALAPPMLEAQIWQWPINTINPTNTNMYMLMAGQDFPGRGKRDLRAA